MANSSATNELLLWELQQRKDKASASRDNMELLKNFLSVLAVIMLTIVVASWLAARARQALPL